MAQLMQTPHTAGGWLRVVGALVLFVLLSPAAASAQAVLIDGYGAPPGFGTGIGYNDDGSEGPIDISPAFPSGVNYYGSSYTDAWVNNNGNVTFNAAVSTYTPLPFPISAQPMLAPFWGDVDTRAGDVNGNGGDEVYYFVDAVYGEFIATWFEVGYYSASTDKLNSFQLIMTNRDDVTPGDFDFEYRYNMCEWTTGDASGGVDGLGGTEAQMGFDAGNLADYWSHPDSQTPDILDLCTTTNGTEIGVWVFEVRSGNPTVCGDGIVSGTEQCDDGNTDPNDGCTACVIYDDADLDGWYGDADCDDGDPSIHPDATEICNGVDDDCDGLVDEGFDADGDGYAECVECDDTDPAINPSAAELPCDYIDNDCDGLLHSDEIDDDGDGFDECQGDCNDAVFAINPGVAEVLCDGIDNDCDLLTPDEPDQDGDGFTVCDDCDDNDPGVNPGAPEVACDYVDNDCDGLQHSDEIDDDGDGYDECSGDCDDLSDLVHPGATEVQCDGIDNDCDLTTPDDPDNDGDGYSVCDDCDDDDAMVNPGAVEICNGLDDDCDGVPAEYEVDADGDGFMDCEDDCDDDDATVYPGAPELCDGIDNDCDGMIDEDVDEDLDGDGYNACQGDCDNEDADVFPGAEEICDGKDNDCDGVLPADEEDADGDGWLVCEDDCDDEDADLNPDDADGDGYSTCDDDCDDEDAGLNLDDADGDGFTTCDEDCDDEDIDVNPDAAEDCEDGLDNNCDGMADEEDSSCGPDDEIDDLTGGCACNSTANRPAIGLAVVLALLGVGLRRRTVRG